MPTLNSGSKSSHKPCTSKVRVVVRLRPFLAREIEAKDGNPISCVSAVGLNCSSDDGIAVLLRDHETSRNEGFKVDDFFGQEDNSVVNIFDKEVSSLIPGIFRGCNATVFAYGATGSGKTYSMQGSDEEPGLIPLAISTILTMCQESGFTAEISYYEVYQEKCYNLLELAVKEIFVWDDKDGKIHLKGLSRVPVGSLSEFHQVFSRGVQRRKVAHTGLNDVSSRSHGVLVITVSAPTEVSGTTITGKLNLIDLAGNEDNRRACNEGIRLQESSKINQSLFALSNVIHALNNNKPRVPYRESKLTRILQDSLGGNSRTLMIACLNPGEYEESLHTIRLVARSRHVSSLVHSARQPETPKVKVDMEAKLRVWRESKGKTTVARKLQPSATPVQRRIPGAVCSSRKQPSSGGFLKGKINRNIGDPSTHDRSKLTLQRNLFDFESVCESSSNGLPDPSIISKDWSSNTSQCSNVPEDGCISSNVVSPVAEDSHLCSLEVSGSKDTGEASSNFVAPVSVDFQIFSAELSIYKDTAEGSNKFAADIDGAASESITCLPDELLEEDEKTALITTGNSICAQSPNMSVKAKSFRSPLRRALSPLHPNINRKQVEEIPSRTPKTPYVVTREKFQFDTPLDKFSVRSSRLKTTLMDEYLDFLNSASREELVELKGIGPKRAEYIIELRENSQLRELSDLEKIGLSSKQVQQMFSSAARVIFS